MDRGNFFFTWVQRCLGCFVFFFCVHCVGLQSVNVRITLLNSVFPPLVNSAVRLKVNHLFSRESTFGPVCKAPCRALWQRFKASAVQKDKIQPLTVNHLISDVSGQITACSCFCAILIKKNSGWILWSSACRTICVCVCGGVSL